MKDYYDNDTMLSYDGDAVVFFTPLKEQYPNLEFTNIDATGVKRKRAVYIFPKDMPRRGNVFVEAWQNKDSFYFILRKSMMTEAEIAESKRDWSKDNSIRGRVRVNMAYKEELIRYIVPKLDMIEAIK